MTPAPLLSGSQTQGVEWLRERADGAYLADPAGYGKTRQLLTAAGGVRLLVVSPAAIRNTEVWLDEVKAIGWDGELLNVSYHELARGVPDFPFTHVVFDEAQHLKNRKVTWGAPALAASKLARKRGGGVWEASGTPMPNDDGTELWGQLRMIREIPAYWAWVAEWFNVVPTQFSAYGVDGSLRACNLKCGVNDCEHWEAFSESEYNYLMLARPESDLDLPPMTGEHTPLHTPMTTEQKRLYRDLRKKLLAELPEEGVTLEALSDTHKFVQLCQLSTSLGSVDPDLDPGNKHSGKLKLFSEIITGRPHPTLAAVYYRNTAAVLARECERMGLRTQMFGANMTPKAQLLAKRAFQAGEVDVMIGSISVIKEGLTLTTGGYVDMVERHWRPDANHQTIKRLHRRGQDKPVMVRQYVTPKSVDEGQWAKLADKQRYIDRAMSRVEVAALV